MKKVLAILMVCILAIAISAPALAEVCDTCGKTFPAAYCNNKHHSYSQYWQCSRQANCDYRANYYSNYYRDSMGHELIANKHQHAIQHSYCGNTFTCCQLSPKP